MIHKIVLAFVLCFSSTCVALAAHSDGVFQYAWKVETKKGNKEAFLWIPAQAEQVRGVLVAGMTSAERDLVRDNMVRIICDHSQIAILFVKTGLGSLDVQATLDAAAQRSGYAEISNAPLFFVGHSAGGPQALACATKFADRCFGLMQYRGGHPGVGRSGGEVPLPPGVPALMILGQFDEFGKVHRDENGHENWENGVDSLAAYNALDAGNLGSIAIEPGAGHFAWSPGSGELFAAFLQKAAKARIPEWSRDAKEPVKCKAIDVASGWRSDLNLAAPKYDSAPAEKYTGDKSRSAWHFDEGMVNHNAHWHRGLKGRKDQFLKWLDKHSVQAGARNFISEITWIGDGRTCEVHPAYAEVYPSQQKDGSGPRWAEAGKSVGNRDGVIYVRVAGGPVQSLSMGPKLRVRFDALSPATADERAVFIAYSPGNEEYRDTELVGILPPGFSKFTEGKDQTITFPVIGNIKADAAPISLKATSDSGLPVEFYVAAGPAFIENGKLHLNQIPRRAKFPLEVKVVAYQVGRALEPKVKSAMPVEQTILIEK